MPEARSEQELIQHARRGSHGAFERAVTPYMPEIRRHCYRMTASLDDADDLLQETLFRAWRGLGAFSGRSSFRSWLYRIATNRSLDVTMGRAWRDPRAHPSGAPGDEPPWLQPFAVDDPAADLESSDAIGLAYLVALQRLTPTARAVLILRDVLGYSAAETAEILETSVAAVNSALQRARRSDPPPAALRRRPRSRRETQMVRTFVDAWHRADIDGLTALLAEDARLTMPPEPLVIAGPREIPRFFADTLADLSATRLEEHLVNGHPGLAVYVPADTAMLHFRGLMLLETMDDKVTRITGFTDPALAGRLGLREHIAVGDG